MVNLFKPLVLSAVLFSTAPAYASETLRIGMALPYTTLDPAKYVDIRSVFVASQIFEPLLRIGPYGDVVPWLAESWVVSEDRKTYTFQLKNNIRFATGAPLTCNDVKYSFARTITSRSDRLTFLKELVGAKNINLDKLDDWAGFRCINGNKFVILLESPSTFFIYSLSDPALYVLPAAERGRIRDGSFFTLSPYGTGPFYVRQLDSEKINLSGNQNYWGRKGGYSSVLLSTVNKTEDATKFDAIIFSKTFDNYNTDYFHKQSCRLSSIVFLGLNTEKPPWDIINNRKIFIESINWNALKKSAYPNSFNRLSGSIIPFGVIGHDPDLQTYPYNPNLTKLSRLFKKYPSAKRLAISTKTDFSVLKKALDETLEPDIALEPIADSPSKIVQIIKNKELQTFVLRPFMNYPDAFLLLEYFKTGNPMNFFGWSNPEYDDLLELARKSDGRHEKYEIYRRLAVLLREAYIAVPIQSQMNQEIFIRNGIRFDNFADENIMYYQLNEVSNDKTDS